MGREGGVMMVDRALGIVGIGPLRSFSRGLLRTPKFGKLGPGASLLWG